MVSILIFVENLPEAFAHYKRAFGATNVGEGYGDIGELIHLEMNILGSKIALAPHSPSEIAKGNVTVICVNFSNKEALLNAYDVLKEDGQTDGLTELPWSPLEGYVTDKYGVVWCIGYRHDM